MGNRETLFTLAMLVAPCCAMVATANAQAPIDSSTLSPIVVTATRIPLPQNMVTARVTVITGEELRAQGVEYLLDALKSVAGANVVQTGSFGGVTSLFLRGGESDYVQVLVDGVPVNEPGGAYDFANLTVDDIERVEIVHGPASVLYGSEAISGVLQVFTRRGKGAPRGSVVLQGGTLHSIDREANLSGGNEFGSYAVSISHFSSNGAYVEDLAGNTFNNDYRNTVSSGRFTVSPDDRTDVGFSVRYSDSKLNFPTDGSGNFVDQNSFTRSKVTTLGLDLSRFLNDRMEARLLLRSNNIDGAFDDAQDDAADTLGFFTFRDIKNVRRQSADTRLNYYFDPITVFTAGAEVEGQTERSFSQSASEFGASNSLFDVSRESRAYYAQALMDIADMVSINVGARLDDNDNFGTFFTYRGGAALRLASGTRIRASIGTGFKEPTFLENFATGFAIGNPDLDPETSLSWEAGVEQAFFDGDLFASGTFFRQDFDDLIQFTFVPTNPGDPNYFNVAAAKASGVELVTALNPIRGLTLRSDFSLIGTEVTDAGFDEGDPDAAFAEGERLLRRPQTTFSTRGTYRLGDRGSVSLTANYVGDRIDRDFSAFPARRVTLNAYMTLDAAAQITIAGRTASIPSLIATLRIENLFDEEYQPAFGFPARGRAIFVGGEVGM